MIPGDTLYLKSNIIGMASRTLYGKANEPVVLISLHETIAIVKGADTFPVRVIDLVEVPGENVEPEVIAEVKASGKKAPAQKVTVKQAGMFHGF